MNNKTLLNILLVLTFIFAGISCLSYLFVAFSQPWLVEFYAANRSMLPDEVYTAMQMMLERPRGFFAALAALYALEVVAGVLMWNLRPSGWHCYILSRLMLILVPLLFIGKGAMGIGDIMMAALFIFIYWHLLRQLGAFGDRGNSLPTPPDSTSQE